MRAVLVLIALALLLTGCQRQAAPLPAPAPTAQPAPAPTPTPAPGGQNLLTYPGATQTNSSSFSGAGPTGSTGQWSTVTMETTDSYEKVRDFYKANAPSGFAQSFTNESTSDGNREFALWFARADQKAWYVITINERKEEGKVEINVASGQAQ
jgi:hypothetical protein